MVGAAEEEAAWTAEEAAELAGATRPHRSEAPFALVLLRGMRIGEALAARWEDVDRERRTLRVWATGVREVVQSRTKGRRARGQPLPPPVWVSPLRQRARRHAGAVRVGANRP
jgi:integrase